MLDTTTTEVLLMQCRAALAATERLHHATRQAVALLVAPEGEVREELLERHQFAAHGLAWQATYVEALRQTLDWIGRLEAAEFGELERAILRLGFAEDLGQLGGGISTSQTEIVRPSEMGVSPDEVARFLSEPALAALADRSALEGARKLLADAAVDGCFGAVAFGDEMLEAMHTAFLHFAAAEIAPHAEMWHREDTLIGLPLIGKLADMGVFGLTVPEAYGGLGLGKVAMCVVSEALSGAYLGVGSLGTRSEIAAELIRIGGTPEQRQGWLPRIASGEISAHCRLHRAGRRLRPRQHPHTRRAPRRHVPGVRCEDLDHARGACRPDDPARSHRPTRNQLSRSFHVARGEAARDRA